MILAPATQNQDAALKKFKKRQLSANFLINLHFKHQMDVREHSL